MIQEKVNAICEKLINADNILIFPHIMPDGDALGSSSALCRALRRCGKNVYILVEDKLADNLSFLDREGYCLYTDGEEAPQEFFAKVFPGELLDVSVMLDCGDYSRIEKRAAYFKASPYTICVDHHATSGSIADLNWVKADSASTGEMVYTLVRYLEQITGKQLLDKEGCEAIFAAITTDTGNFQYSNTTSDSHRIVMEMMQQGFDHNKVSVLIYQSNRLEYLQLKGAVIDRMRAFAEGKIAVSYVSQQMLADIGANLDETEGIVDELRKIATVEVAVFLKELPDTRIKVSLRAKSRVNVAKIAALYGGGGHMRAAGCTFHEHTIDEVIEKIVDSLTQELSEESCQ